MRVMRVRVMRIVRELKSQRILLHLHKIKFHNWEAGILCCYLLCLPSPVRPLVYNTKHQSAIYSAAARSWRTCRNGGTWRTRFCVLAIAGRSTGLGWARCTTSAGYIARAATGCRRKPPPCSRQGERHLDTCSRRLASIGSAWAGSGRASGALWTRQRRGCTRAL